MAERANGPPVMDLERSLRDLAGRLDAPVPPAGSVARAVAARIEAGPEGDRAGARARASLGDRLADRFGSRSRVVAVLVAGLLLLAGAAVAVGLTVGRIVLQPADTPGPATTGPGASPTASPSRPPEPTFLPLGLGPRVHLEQAREAVDFALRVPAPEGPAAGIDEVRLNRAVPGGMVSFVYRPVPGLPEIGRSGAGMVITQFDGSVQGLKEYDPARPPVPVDVDGEDGLFVEGVHSFLFVDADGELRLGSRRVVGSTLIWQSSDEVVLRIESALPLRRVLPIARSLEPGGN
jgi:hypothetical protein